MRRILFSAVITAFLMPLPAYAQSVSSPVEVPATALMPGSEAAVAVVDGFHEALQRGDKAGAIAALDPSVVIYEEGYVERSRAEYETHHLDSDAEFSASSTSTITNRSAVVSGDVAWVTSEGRTVGAAGDRTIDRITTETMVLKRGPGGWLIQHIHWSSRAG